MRQTLLALALLTSLAACQKAESPTAPATDGQATAAAVSAADAAFTDLSARALEGWFQLSPVSATQIGDHRFDGELDDLSEAGRARGLEFSQNLLAELQALDVAALSRENQVDAAILRNQLQYDIWNAQTLQGWAWDPQLYSGLAGQAIYGLMAREFAPLPERLKSATARMQKIPALLAQARANLDPARVPKVHAETVARQNAGVLGIVDTFITPHLDQLDPADRQQAQAAIDGLKTAVAEHQKWLDETLVPNAKGEFRVGAEVYDQKLQFALLSSLSRAEIKQRAEAELVRVRGEMYAIAQQVLKDTAGAPQLPDNPGPQQQQKAIEAALELAYAQHPARDQVVADARVALDRATAFVREHDLVTVPDAPVEIIEMPE
ncbi:MAG: DUF885 domain-containing protein, partial [Pseudoxanthomonas sp.]|nr:DUF885 domain-containing protein [Pseudoxanthomonas sp.]